jgi:hypothetical protein
LTNNDIAKALVRLQPDAIWSLVGDDYNDIDWQSTDITKPTLAAIKKEIETPTVSAEIKAKVAARQAILDRLGLTADEAKLLLG